MVSRLEVLVELEMCKADTKLKNRRGVSEEEEVKHLPHRRLKAIQRRMTKLDK